ATPTHTSRHNAVSACLVISPTPSLVMLETWAPTMRSFMSCWSKLGLPRSNARRAFPALRSLPINIRSCWSLAMVFQSPFIGRIATVASAPCTAWTSPPSRSATAVFCNCVASSCGSAWNPSTFNRTSLMYRSASARCRAATLMMRAVSRSFAVALALKPTIAAIRIRNNAMIQPNFRPLRIWIARVSVASHLQKGVHSSEVVPFEVAEEDVPARREVQDKLCPIANVEFAQLVDGMELRGVLVDEEPIGSKRELGCGQVGSDHDQLVSGWPQVMHKKHHMSGRHGRRGRGDAKVSDRDGETGPVASGRAPRASRKADDRRSDRGHDEPAGSSRIDHRCRVQRGCLSRLIG